MSEFLKFYHLCPIEDPNEFLGISPDTTEGNIIATLNKSHVVVIKISTRKQLYSWTTVEKLSTKVVYDKQSQKYVGVFGFSNLRCWDLTTKNVNSCKKLKFSKLIADLITLPQNTIVLYMDGTFESLEDAIESRKENKTKDPMEQYLVTISDAKVFALPNGRFILTYFERQNDTGDLFIVRAPIDFGTTVKLPLKRDEVNATLSGYAVLDSDNQPELITIWSDNRMFSLPLSEDAISADKAPGRFLAMTLDSNLNVNKQICMHRLEEDYAVMYGESTNKDGAYLLLYNLQYNVFKARQFFKVFFENTRVWQLDGHIFLAQGRNLAVVSYTISKETLADLLGCKVTDPFQKHTAIEYDWIEYRKDIQMERYAERPGIYEEAKKLALKIVREAHDKKGAESKDVFGIEKNNKIVKTFEELVAKMNSQSISTSVDVTDQANNSTTVVKVKKHKKTAKLKEKKMKDTKGTKGTAKKQRSTQFLFSETPRCLKSHEEESQKYRSAYSTANFNVILNNQTQKLKFAGDTLLEVDLLTSNNNKAIKLLMSNSDDEYRFTPAVHILISELEKSGCSEHEITEKLLFLLTKADLKEDIIACLRRYSNISEKVIAKTLKYVLEKLVKDNADTTNETEENKMEVDEATKSQNITVLNLLLTFPFEEDVLSLNLRHEIDITLFIYLIEHMFSILTEPYKEDWVPVSTMTSLQFEVQLLRWLGVLMNSHFQKVALSKDLHLLKLLTQWVELLEIYQQGVTEMNDFAAVLTDLIDSKKADKEQNCSKWYSIEEIELH